MLILKKELKIFLFLFLFLALSMHFSAWIDHPIEHIKSLSQSSLGTWHPIVITFGLYVLIAMGRGVVHFIKKALQKKQ